MGEKDVIDNIIILWLPTYDIFQVQKCVKKKKICNINRVHAVIYYIINYLQLLLYYY